MRTILSVVGARPQFVKAAPVSRALADAGFREILVHTGQHFDAAMSAVFFEELGIPRPAHELDVHSLPHGAMTGRMLEKLEAAMLVERPDMALVYGDTNSTLAGALAAAKLRIPVAHVEAGLRSFNKAMPEEQNRIVADHLSTLRLCPTRASVVNLAREGIVGGVVHVGDVMFDTTLFAAERARSRSRIVETLGLAPRGYAVATVHRAENTDDPARLARVFDWLAAAARTLPVVLPLHPRTRAALGDRPTPEGVRCIAPLGYLDMTRLTSQAAAVFTDSGGLQKEAYFHRVPCVTLREETEWVETIEAGWNRLWTVESYAPRVEIADYGEGRAAQAIAAAIVATLER
jgi:UDP-GlcNAc3NAcA epimerase